MENVRKAFKILSNKCCFNSEYTNTEGLEAEGKGNLDITSSQIPKIPEKLEQQKESCQFQKSSKLFLWLDF